MLDYRKLGVSKIINIIPVCVWFKSNYFTNNKTYFNKIINTFFIYLSFILKLEPEAILNFRSKSFCWIYCMRLNKLLR